LEELHFCDSGGPPPSKSKASSFAFGDAEPLPGETTVLKRRMKFQIPYSAILNR